MGRLSFLFRLPVLPLTLLVAGILGWWLGGITSDAYFVILFGALSIVTLYGLRQASEDRGYWQAHREIAEIMQLVVNQDDVSETQMLYDLIAGITAKTVSPRAHRSLHLWRHTK